MSAKILAVIPARYASSRFPGKPLALIDGKPMVQWVFEAASRCDVFDHVVVATDDDRIAKSVRAFGGQVELTRGDHKTGTDRVAEASERYPDFNVVANVQGDQPFVTSEILSRLMAVYRETEPSQWPEMATVAAHLEPSQYADPNSVKVICDRRMNALYFSRSPIPFFRSQVDAPVYHHLGLYAFTATFLNTFCSLEPTPLECAEELEQLRALENGYRLQVSLVDSMIHEVNVPMDLELANTMACGH